MSFPFDETKATQAAAWLLTKAGGRMSHIKLSKLLYIADREALARWGRPLIGGTYSSMPHGPVISPVVDCLRPAEDREDREIWDRCLARSGNQILLKNDPGRGQLHAAAIRLLDDLFAAFQHQSKWEVRDLTHTFPEYIDPNGSSLPIELKALLEVLNQPEQDVVGTLDAAKHRRKVNHLIAI